MRIKRKNGLKVAAITIALLLCLALAVGITGAWYQAKRQATGTLSMDQGIIIDYKGFGKTDEGIWTRETTTTFLLFDETNAQPGEEITVNAAGIRANEKSVNFYARVKLSYKFYNGETLLYDSNTTTGNVEGFKPSDLITTSANFFGTNWVDGGSTDGYYYYATGSTLNKFEKGAAATTPFVNLFADGAYFKIEDEEFKGEGGGFKIDDTTSINKIEVYLTLETLQGDADAAAEGWKIAAGQVDFSKIQDNAKVENSSTQDAFPTTTEEEQKQAKQAEADFKALQVGIDDNQKISLSTLKFPYDEEVTLNFDSRNVDYITLIYSNGESETFGFAAEDFANDYQSETALKVTAKSSKGTVKGYTVGLWDSEYTGFTYSTKGYDLSSVQEDYETGKEYEIEGGIAVSGYLGDCPSKLEIESITRVRERDLKVVITGYSSVKEFNDLFGSLIGAISYPCTIDGHEGVFNSIQDLVTNWYEPLEKNDWAGFMDDDSPYKNNVIFRFSTLVNTLIGGSKMAVKEVGASAFAAKALNEIIIPEGVTKINYGAFVLPENSQVTENSIELPSSLKIIEGQAFQCRGFKSINFPDALVFIGQNAFYQCKNLTNTIADLNGTWLYAEDGYQTINGESVMVKKGDIVDSDILLRDIKVNIEKQTV